MSQDPHAPTPAGPDPDEETAVRPPVDDADAPVADAPLADPPFAAADEPAAVTDEPVIFADEPVEPTPTVSLADATQEHPAGTAAPVDDWLTPDATAADPAPRPDPPFPTPPAFTPPGTPEDGGSGPLSGTAASGPLDQAKALTDRPEVMVGVAFAVGVVASFVLKRFGR